MREFRDHFSEIAPGYATYRPHYPEALFDFLADEAPDRRLAWDCACGNGQATLDLAARFDHVVGTDASAGQIAEAPEHPRIEWRVAAETGSGIASATCDLVTCAQALHWLDSGAFFREATRVTQPGGLVAVWCYGDVRVDEPRADALVRYCSETTVGPYWPRDRRLVHEGYRSITMPFDEIDVPELPMTERWSLEQLIGYIRTWSATSAYRKAKRKDPTVELAARLAEVWGDPEETREVSWPLTVRVGRVSSS